MDHGELRSGVWPAALSAKATILRKALAVEWRRGPERREDKARGRGGQRGSLPRLFRSPQRLTAQPAGGHPTASPAGYAFDGVCPEQKRPRSVSFPLLSGLTQQGRENG